MTVGSSELEGSQSVLWVVERCSDQGLRGGGNGALPKPQGQQGGACVCVRGSAVWG